MWLKMQANKLNGNIKKYLNKTISDNIEINKKNLKKKIKITDVWC